MTAGRYTPFLRAPLTPAGATVASKVGFLPLSMKLFNSSGLDMSDRSDDVGQQFFGVIHVGQVR